MKELNNFRKFLTENEEKTMYNLVQSRVEYDNGKSGYLYQLLDMDGDTVEEDWFEDIHVDDNLNPMDFGADFNSFDIGSTQEIEVTKEKAIQLSNKLSKTEI